MMHRRAALFGVTSRVGPGILQAFVDELDSSGWSLTLVLRPSSKQPEIPSKGKNRIQLYTLKHDNPSTEDLAAAFEEINCGVVISALNAALVDLHKSMADACVKAGVSRFIPADYGSIRSDDVWALDLMQNFRNKIFVRWHCQRLADMNPEFTWTSLATGHFFDYGLRTELLGFDVRKGKALLFDGGDLKWSASTTLQIGRAVIRVLQHLDQTANQMLLIHSFIVTQNQVISEIEKVTGKMLKGKVIDARKYLLENSAKGAAGDAAATEEAVAVMGIMRSYFPGNPAFANEVLGLDEENMADVVRATLS